MTKVVTPNSQANFCSQTSDNVGFETMRINDSLDEENIKRSQNNLLKSTLVRVTATDSMMREYTNF